jgi:hypothetical protein
LDRHTVGVEDSEQEQHLLERLRELFPPGSRLDLDCEVTEVRSTPGEAVLIFKWERDPRLYGIPISLSETSKEFYYSDYPVDSIEEWLESVGLGMEIYLGTGFWARARRARVEDYIELRSEGAWPDDDRFYFGVVGPRDDDSWLRVPYVAEAGLDTSAAVASRDAGRLIGWVTVYENNSTGHPYVGQAVASWSSDTTASIDHVEVVADIPITVMVDLARMAAHAAGAAGALSVTTDLDLEELKLAGFRYDAHGVRAVDTSFLDEDPAGASALLQEVLVAPGQWGRDRDSEGRHLPPNRVARWWHRVKHGPSGGSPRTYVG